MTLVLILLLGALLAQQPAPASAAMGLDFEVYRTRVEPIFLKPRAANEGSGNACYLCHTTMATPMRLQPLAPGATTWTEEQSRQNFEVVSRLVAPSDPPASPLLRHPLATEAGGDAQHTGGKFWLSQDNVEWQTIAAWVRAASTAGGATALQASAAPTLDFEFFKRRVEPIFLAPRGEHARCVSCHGPPLGLARLKTGAVSWTEEESRQNFESIKRLVTPGDPTASRLLMHPLAANAGGDPFHTGGKHWLSQDDSEWQTLAAWVRGQTLSSPAPAPATTVSAAAGLDFEMYRTRIEPIFLKPRAANEGSGNACYLCHTTMATPMRLQPLAPEATTWTEEQSRQNFEVVSRLVAPSDPSASPLLRHPLATEAGGDAQHTGGKFWLSQDNVEWQTIAAWVRAASAAGSTTALRASAAVPILDFEFFKTRVEPIFLAPRGEHARCVSCHGPPLGLVRLKTGAVSWTEEESRQNFESIKRLVTPGDPTASRLLMHPLAANAGGDPFHTGGKHWLSQDDSEWQTLAAWVRGQTLNSPR